MARSTRTQLVLGRGIGGIRRWLLRPSCFGSPFRPLIHTFVSILLPCRTALLTMLPQIIINPSEIGDFEQVEAIKRFLNQVLVLRSLVNLESTLCQRLLCLLLGGPVPLRGWSSV